MTNPLLKITTVSKDRFYFDRYEYCFNFKVPELTALRELDHAAIDRELDYRSSWRQRNPNFGGSWRSRREEITDSQRNACHSLCDYLLLQQDYKLVIYGDWGYLYTNNLSMIHQMHQLSYVLPTSLKKVTVDLPRDSILIKSSQHEWRSYFRAGRITDQQKQSLANFLLNQQDIRLGPGLKKFLANEKYHYINDNVFIDHDGQGVITMLGLIQPRCIRKTLKLVRDK